MRTALGNGFRAIAGFIFGKNQAPDSSQSTKVAMTSPGAAAVNAACQPRGPLETLLSRPLAVTLEMSSQPASAKIAMTSPVAAELSGKGTYRVSFIMPSQYTKATLPKPTNPGFLGGWPVWHAPHSGSRTRHPSACVSWCGAVALSPFACHAATQTSK